MVLPVADPITQWYKNKPPFAQIVKLTSDILPAPSFAAFLNYSDNHSQVMTKGYRASMVPFVNSSGFSV
jgi:hypothetical protein